ncbi:hypothetical protein [Streptomyces fagopyri]|uniref:hypothetical protein n=1 Tax=Streptomyces fagopyri TaxID=2662397 RepID=UPI0033E8D79B
MVTEVVMWQAALSALWVVLISAIDPLELYVGLGCALPAAITAAAARRAVSGR